MWLAAGAILLVLLVLAWRIRTEEGEAVAQGHVVHVSPPEEVTTPPTPRDSTIPAPEQLRVRVLRRLPHDPEAFTQGLEVHPDGRVFESTGLNGRSSLREVVLDSGVVTRRREVDAQYFAEGLTIVDDRLIQLTWQDGVAFEYDLATFEPRRQLAYTGEGWGLAWDGARLVMSDGSSALVFRDPDTFAELGRVTVTTGGVELERLNELECAGGLVWANVWLTDFIARIDPASGAVVDWLDLTGLLTREQELEADVLNGIAIDPVSGRVFVTGKDWPSVFEIQVAD